MPPRSDSGRRGADPPPHVAPTLVPAEGTALYVHLPHCVVKCTYCDFYSVVEESPDLAGTVDTLLAEARVRAPRRPRTVFLGGGTPSLLPEGELARLLDGLDELTGFRASAVEVTCESNPESLTPAKAWRLVELGVDRLTLGIQSFDPDTLRLFGRAHSVEQALAAFEAARAAGFRSLGIDLIYGVPGQEPAAWREHLARVGELGPDHVSAYSLAFEPGTALTHERDTGRLTPLPEERDLELFLDTRCLLGELGYGAYEVSNFARSGHHCRHNEVYWRNEPYVGIGPGAVSRLGPARFGNPRSIPLWHAGVQAQGHGLAWEELLEPRARLGETWWLGLRRTCGVDPAEARRTVAEAHDLPEGELLPDPCLALAQELAGQGLLEARGSRWCLTERGLPLADAVSARFLHSDEERAATSTEAGSRRPA